MIDETLIFGHRGYPAKFPENSLSGFSYAIDHAIDGLEFDVHLTKDNIPVIMHDEKINRTTNGRGKIRQYTFDELQQFQLSNGETIPSLEQLLQLVAQRRVYLNLEFKTDRVHYTNIEKIVLDMVRDYDLVYPVIYSSFSLQTLKNAYRVDAHQQYCLLSDHVLHQPQRLAQIAHLSGVHLKHYQNLPNLEERIWTVDDPQKMKQLFEKRVAGIITDDFEMAQSVKPGVLV
ncbi:glycerophosphodiester phosphodiesterase [Paucilactobacillus vaccinostercus DSM 20634]|uniref:Glycerophosphodiester phosphodiesterase n=1 Tax=Paucilactobacillus vaccinostercus DSM 20634 TaxID=1423813 RepID=A0A0R2A453_9LACO|nr:glycerophosphodiester phosphodiesterase family protein [Paucilactobacillus vaccinostercus]KRM61258.1 glycerophosphodiester phosphodiesterase [Paucilactobacillus vaccinostercus DSM 20634]